MNGFVRKTYKLFPTQANLPVLFMEFIYSNNCRVASGGSCINALHG
jgi:hypothetical protein